MTRRYLAVFGSVIILSLSACGGETATPPDTTIQEESAEIEEPIPESADEDVPDGGPIQVGVFDQTVAPLLIIEGDAFSGFEVDFAREIVARMYGENTAVEFIPIAGQERFSSLAEGRIDMLIRSTVHTKSREEQALFSGSYLLSGNGFLVRQDEGYNTIADLDGDDVAVLSYMQESLMGQADLIGVSLGGWVVETQEEAFIAFSSGQAKALYHDWMLLVNLMDPGSDNILLDESRLAPIGVAFSLDKQDLRDRVNSILQEMIADGTWQTLYDKWISFDVRWDVDGMFDVPPVDR